MNKESWRAVNRAGYASFVDQDHGGTSRQEAFPDMLRLMLQQGVDVDALCASGSTALMDACPEWGSASFAGELVAVSALLEHGASVDVGLSDGRTPLAAVMDWFRKVAGPYIEVYWPKAEATGHAETTKERYFEAFAGKLLLAGANPRQADLRGRTALGVARECGKRAIASFTESRALAAKLKASKRKLDASELMADFGWTFGER